MPVLNPNFEDAGLLPGEAEHWMLASVTSLESIAWFRADPELAWEGFERWVASIRVDGSPLAQATCAPGRERVLTDLVANVSKLAGVRDVAVHLALEEV